MTDPLKEAAAAGQDLADWIDSSIMMEYLRDAAVMLDNAPVPLVGRYFYNPESGEVEPWPQ